MSTLRRLLQEADPLRHEAPPSFEAVRERVRVASSPATSTAPLVRARRPFALAFACAAVVLMLFWAGGQDSLVTTPVAAQVRFEVRLAEDHPVPGLLVAQVANTTRVIYLHPEAVVGNDDLAQAWVVDDGTPRFAVSVRILPDGAERMRRATAGHLGRPVAMLIDGTVVMAPIVRSAIGDSAVISGGFTREEATRIVEGIERR